MSINPQSDRAYVNDYRNRSLTDQVKRYPKFFTKIEFEIFRHIRNLSVEFQNPITVISGTNKSGKTSILLAIACSHYNFQKKDYSTNTFKRTTWGDVMKFTNHDQQQVDWTYYVSYRNGDRSDRKRGQRKSDTKKWNGVAKKESQIGTPTNGREDGRKVYFIDLDRIVPARKLSLSTYKNACRNNMNTLENKTLIEKYVSYILESQYKVGLLYANVDNEVFGYENSGYKYSSYNTASGEDVLTRIIEDIVNADKDSLILIEEIEIGLHPKIQRRLMDILYIESKRKSKQFIITTHSSTIISSVLPESRVFIENINNNYRLIPNISINAALTKMDSLSYPLVNIYVEDNESNKLLTKAIYEINKNLPGFFYLVKIVEIGAADRTYGYFKIQSELYKKENINVGYACVLDGDMKEKKDDNGNLKYPSEELLYFHYSNEAPEKMLLKAYLNKNNNTTLEYHCNNSNPHCFFEKMVEEGICVNKDDAFDMCWNALIATQEGTQYLEEMKTFIINVCKKFSMDL